MSERDTKRQMRETDTTSTPPAEAHAANRPAPASPAPANADLCDALALDEGALGILASTGC